MNPDAYMPFFGDDFFRAIKGHPHHVGFGYIKAIWHYWKHEHCQGLRDDSNYLRSVCELDPDEWSVAQEIIFDNDRFFTLGEDGKWHQKRAAEEYQIAKRKYEQAVARGKAGAKRLWKGKR